MVEESKFASRTLETVYHVGHLDEPRSKPYTSFEGRGLSVSRCPNDWRRIMDYGGGPLFTLSHPEGGVFYEADVDNGPRDRELDWALNNGYVTEVDGFRVEWQEDGETHFMLFYDEERAEREAAEPDAAIRAVRTVTLAEEGRAYWSEAFRQEAEKASPVLIRGLLPVWFAEAQGFDGVWWDEEYAPYRNSAPRGVIFQSSLGDWVYRKGWHDRVESVTSEESEDFIA